VASRVKVSGDIKTRNTARKGKNKKGAAGCEEQMNSMEGLAWEKVVPHTGDREHKRGLWRGRGHPFRALGTGNTCPCRNGSGR